MQDFERLLKQNIYYQFLFDDYSLGLTPLIVGFEKCDPAKPLITFKKPHFVIHFVLKGSGTYSIRGKNYDIHERTVFLNPAEEKISYKPHSTDPWEYVWIEFSGIASKVLLEEAGLTPDHPVYCPLTFERIETLLYSLVSESLNRRGKKNLAITADFMSIFDVLISERKSPEDTNKPKFEKRVVEESLRYLEKNYAKSDISIDALAKSLYFNPTHLTKLFKKEMGVSMIQYVIDLRMKKACEMLSTHQYSISEIATNVGYSNQFYFSKVFKNYYKTTPSRYYPENTCERK
jgi:AraC-like DNA-binding protein